MRPALRHLQLFGRTLRLLHSPTSLMACQRPKSACGSTQTVLAGSMAYAFIRPRPILASIPVIFGRILGPCLRRSPSRTKRPPDGNERICPLQSPLPPEPRMLPLCYSQSRHFSNPGYFVQSHDQPPLHALADGVAGPNGLWHDSADAFPTDSATTPLTFGWMSSLATIRDADVGNAPSLALRSKSATLEQFKIN